MPLTPPSSFSGLIFSCFPGVFLSLYDGARPFSFGNGWSNSLYPSYQAPLSALLLRFKEPFHLYPTHPSHRRPSCGKTPFPVDLRFSPILDFCDAFERSSKPLVCQPKIMPATLFDGVVPLLLFVQGCLLSLLKSLGTGIRMLCSFT